MNGQGGRPPEPNNPSQPYNHGRQLPEPPPHMRMSGPPNYGPPPGYGPPPPNWGPPPPPQVIVQKKRGCLWFIGLIVVILIVSGIFFGTRAGTGSTTSGDSHAIEFKVTGIGQASVNWGTISGQSSDGAVSLPWSKKKTVKGFDSPSVVAQRGSGSGSISCQILVDGVSKASESASGEYAVVTCAAATE